MIELLVDGALGLNVETTEAGTLRGAGEWANARAEAMLNITTH